MEVMINALKFPLYIAFGACVMVAAATLGIIEAFKNYEDI